MVLSFHKEVTTPEALASSIDNDQHVLRWFTWLVVQPAIRDRQIKIPRLTSMYKTLRVVIFSQYVLYLITLASILMIAYLQEYRYLWGGIALAIAAIYLHQRLKYCVREISMDLMLADFELPTLRQKTLYQISEFYSRKYEIPSLVDNIFHWDNTVRILLIICTALSAQMLALIFKIPKVNFLLTIGMLLGLAYLVFMLIHAYILYKTLKTS